MSSNIQALIAAAQGQSESGQSSEPRANGSSGPLGSVSARLSLTDNPHGLPLHRPIAQAPSPPKPATGTPTHNLASLYHSPALTPQGFAGMKAAAAAQQSRAAGTGPRFAQPPHALAASPTSPMQNALGMQSTSSAASNTSAATPAASKKGKQVGGAAAPSVADEIAETVGAKKDRKRKRVHYSCAECHRRKHKCDRKIPCKPCVDRGIGADCRPFEEGDQHGDVRDRVSRLEDIVEGLALAHRTLAQELASVKGMPIKGDSRATMDLLRLAGVAVDDLQGEGSPAASGALKLENGAGESPDPRAAKRARANDGERAEQNGARAKSAASADKNDPDAHELEIERRTLDGGFAQDGDAWFGALALPSVSRGVIETEIHGEKLELGARMPKYPASHKLNRLIYEGGAPPDILDQLMSGLPPRAETDALLDLYFRDINYTRLPIHEADFRQSYEDLMEFRWGDAEERLGDDGARHLPFLSLLYSILAIARQANAENRESFESATSGATRLYHLCRKCTLVASVIRVDHIDLVLTHLFTARFLTVQRQSAEAWSQLGTTIRAAQAIGLHRDGSKLGMDGVTTERRRRIWALIFWMDKTTSILLGRPQAIQEMHCDTLPPSDIDIDTMPRSTQPLPPKPPCQDPKAPPGIYAYVAIRHELSKLTGKIVEHFQNLSSPRKYSDCLRLDEDLEKFQQSLPPPYRSEPLGNIDRSFDEVCPWLPLHRYLLNVEYHYVRIALHRPYVLRNSNKYSQSRKAAFQSAKMDRLIRQEYKRDVKWPVDRARKVHMGGLYRLFNATMMIGVALLLDPNSPEAPELLAILDEFVEQHKASDFADFCSKREVKIIELFRAKARDPSWCAATATGARKREAEPSRSGANTPKLGPPLSSLRSTGAAAGASPVPTTAAGTVAGLNQGFTPPEGSSGSTDGDVAQTIFDQLGGLENFGLYQNTSTPGDGTLAPQPMTLDLNNGFDEFIDFWSEAPGGVAGEGKEAKKSAASLPPPSQNGPEGRSSPALGPSGMSNLGRGAVSISFPPSSTPAPAPHSGAKDSSLIPWGGLIEAIAPSSQGTPAPHSTSQPQRR